MRWKFERRLDLGTVLQLVVTVLALFVLWMRVETVQTTYYERDHRTLLELRREVKGVKESLQDMQATLYAKKIIDSPPPLFNHIEIGK